MIGPVRCMSGHVVLSGHDDVMVCGVACGVQEVQAGEHAARCVQVGKTVLHNNHCLRAHPPHHRADNGGAVPREHQHQHRQTESEREFTRRESAKYGAGYYQKTPTAAGRARARARGGAEGSADSEGDGAGDGDSEGGVWLLHAASVPLMCLDSQEVSALMLPASDLSSAGSDGECTSCRLSNNNK